MEEINPCPWCGGEDVAFHVETQEDAKLEGTDITYRAFCHTCGASGPPTEKGTEEARKVWNQAKPRKGVLS